MEEILIQIFSLLPAATIVFVIAYFYVRKKAPGLLIMLISYIVVLFVSVAYMYIPYYQRDRAATAEEMQKVYTGISIISMLAHVVFAIGLGILLSHFHDWKEEQNNVSF